MRRAVRERLEAVPKPVEVVDNPPGLAGIEAHSKHLEFRLLSGGGVNYSLHWTCCDARRRNIVQHVSWHAYVWAVQEAVSRLRAARRIIKP